MQTTVNNESLIVVDGHVHIHSCFDLEILLDNALSNFQTLHGHNAAFCLALTESKSQNYFHRLFQLSQGKESGLNLNFWQIIATDEPCSLYAQKSEARSTNTEGVYLIAGRQVVTLEGLEVLALLTEETFLDGYPIEQTIHDVLESGGIPVIPWGFGKWMGNRGRRLLKLLQSSIPGLFLADNSGRPIFWPEPVFFQQAKQQGIAILSGTDPFPFKSEVNRPGRAGFSIYGALDPLKPATSLRKLLLYPNSSPELYGDLEAPLQCLRNQIAIQYLKHFRNNYI
ncbi:MAG: hypothetical protein WBM44_25400 [Waterburya sp.]